MSLSDKEKRTVGIGTLVVVVALTYRALTAGDSLAAESSGDSIEGATLRIDQHDRFAGSVESLSKRLNVEVSDASLGDQEASIRGDLAAKLKASGLQFKDLRRLDVKSGSRGDAINPIEFRIEIAGQFKSVLGFIGEAEASSIPYVVRAVQVSSASPAGKAGGGKAPPPTGNVKAIMKIRGYLFPPGKPTKPEADSKGKPDVKSDAKAGVKTDAKVGVKPAAKETPKENATPPKTPGLKATATATAEVPAKTGESAGDKSESATPKEVRIKR